MMPISTSSKNHSILSGHSGDNKNWTITLPILSGHSFFTYQNPKKRWNCPKPSFSINVFFFFNLNSNHLTGMIPKSPLNLFGLFNAKSSSSDRHKVSTLKKGKATIQLEKSLLAQLLVEDRLYKNNFKLCLTMNFCLFLARDGICYS